MINGLRVVASVEARMQSERLPGKVLTPCLGRPMLAHLVERAKRSQFIDDVVVATTVKPADDAIVACCDEIGALSYRGSESNVSERVMQATFTNNAQIIVQLTGDNPCVDPGMIDQFVRLLACNKGRLDFVTNAGIQTFPEGFEVQVMSMEVMQASYEMSKDGPLQEHVCLAVHENPDKFRIFNVAAEAELCRPDYRLTMDTAEDLQLILKVFAHFQGRHFDCADAVQFLDENQELLRLNAHIENKPVR